jgi:hypothetical protein
LSGLEATLQTAQNAFENAVEAKANKDKSAADLYAEA